MKDFAIYTVCSGSFWRGFAALVESVRQNANLPVDSYVFIVYTPEDVPVEFTQWQKTRTEEIVVVDCRDAELQGNADHLRLKRLLPAFLKLNIFEDTVRAKCSMLLDSDMICLGDLSEVGGYERPVAVTDSALYLETPPTKEEFYKQSMHVNTGFFTFQPDKKLYATFKELYDADPSAFQLADQDVYNEWERRNDIVELVGSKWNCIKTVFTGPDGLRVLPVDVRILHFLVSKPWELGVKIGRWEMNPATIRLEYLWWSYYEKSGYSSNLIAPKVMPLCRYIKAHFFATIRRTKRKLSRITSR
ncbi:MAG: glycosyltransferase [Opitutaceae bacterium]